MPPARALVEAGATVALATDFNPGSAFCESLPLVCSLAATQLSLSPAESLAACTVNAAHVLGRADRLGRLAPGYAADIVLIDAPDWRYLAYHLGGDLVARVVLQGAARGARLTGMPTKKQRRRAAEGPPPRVRVRLRRRRGQRGRPVEPDRPARPRRRTAGREAAQEPGPARRRRRPARGAARSSRRPGGASPSAALIFAPLHVRRRHAPQPQPAVAPAGLPDGLPARVLHPVQLLHGLDRCTARTRSGSARRASAKAR